MKLRVENSSLQGSVSIPGSKSHTIRALILATLADGESRIRKPLDSLDTMACLQACRQLGARINTSDPDCWTVNGVAGYPAVPDNVIDVGNSGTTLYVIMGTAVLCSEGHVVITGDEQIRRRPAGRLVSALNELGARVFSTRGNGKCPLVLKGPLKGGNTSIEAITSQWVTSILMCAPLGAQDTEMRVPLVNEAPYIRMTLDWLESLEVRLEYCDNFSWFRIPAGQGWKGFDRPIPADFSSATFFLVAGAILGGDIELHGLDMQDSQGDKEVVEYLKKMGAQIEINEEARTIRVYKSELKGCELDLNRTPDALPAMAVAAALADGETRLVNVANARLKETDRISVMTAELGKMGVQITEQEDGLIIAGGGLQAASDLNGHGDHRVVMALALATMAASGESRISTAEAMAVTFPEYEKLMRQLGGNMELIEE